jgi:hypothetical protein
LRPFDNFGVFLYQIWILLTLSLQCARGTWRTAKFICRASMAQGAHQSPFSPASPFPQPTLFSHTGPLSPAIYLSLNPSSPPSPLSPSSFGRRRPSAPPSCQRPLPPALRPTSSSALPCATPPLRTPPPLPLPHWCVCVPLPPPLPAQDLVAAAAA